MEVSQAMGSVRGRVAKGEEAGAYLSEQSHNNDGMKGPRNNVEDSGLAAM